MSQKFAEDFLETFIRLLSMNNHAQGTAKFLAGRTRIGASEAHKLNICSRASILELINRKVAPGYNPRAMALVWGQLFEDVHLELIQAIFGVRVFKSPGNIPGPAGASASPDGLGVIIDDGKYQFTLYEFKCPYSRQVDIRDKIKPEYYAQIQWGLAVLNGDTQYPMFTKALFSEAQFRICSYDQFNFGSDYNHQVPQDDTEYEEPEFIGVQYLIEGENIFRIRQLYESGMIDFGEGRNLEDLKVLDRGIDYRPVVGQIFRRGKNGAFDPKERLKKEPKKCFGVVYWKLFKIAVRLFDREPDYINERKERLDAITAIIQEAKVVGMDKITPRLVVGGGTIQLLPTDGSVADCEKKATQERSDQRDQLLDFDYLA
jgi:hypothetical protein